MHGLRAQCGLNDPEHAFYRRAQVCERERGWVFYPQPYMSATNTYPDFAVVLAAGRAPSDPLPRDAVVLIELDGRKFHNRALDDERDHVSRDVYGLRTWRGDSAECMGPRDIATFREFVDWADRHLATHAASLKIDADRFKSPPCLSGGGPLPTHEVLVKHRAERTSVICNIVRLQNFAVIRREAEDRRRAHAHRDSMSRRYFERLDVRTVAPLRYRLAARIATVEYDRARRHLADAWSKRPTLRPLQAYRDMQVANGLPISRPTVQSDRPVQSDLPPSVRRAVRAARDRSAWHADRRPSKPATPPSDDHDALRRANTERLLLRQAKRKLSESIPLRDDERAALVASGLYGREGA